MMAPNRLSKAHNSPDAVCLGLITLGTLIIVDKLPETNTGAVPENVREYLSDDGVIAALALKQWGVTSGVIGTKLGRDAAGQKAIRQLTESGVVGSFKMTSKYRTPLEISIADKGGNRTYYWDRREEPLSTLDEADLSMIETAKLLYVDWYDHGHILTALKTAKRAGVPTFFNFEHGHENAELLSLYGQYSTIIQGVTDAAQVNIHPEETGERLLKNGASIALVTLASQGCLALTQDESIRVYAPKLDVVDGNAAGATFSGGFMYGTLQGWGLERTTRFAVAAASLKCTVVGLAAFPVSEIETLADQLTVG
ncbi:MAG: PfkB family carbohydrate kinase [Chloroflexota bacterium]|nr:PfkB family carbohydrate kinase [Chloroflexota bacterium]